MQTINMHEAKTHLSHLVGQAAMGDESLIARAGRPVARLTPLATRETAPRALGLGRGKFSLPKGFSTLHADTIQQMFETGE